MTTLAIGDIAIIGYNAEGSDDGFSFVLLTDVDALTEIKFTDTEWRGGGFDTGEGAVSWTSGAALTAGTVVRLQFNNTAGTESATVGSITRGIDQGFFDVGGNPGFMSLSTSGDHIIAFQGSPASPSVLTAFTNRPAGFVTGNTSETELPPGLTIGTNALHFIDRGIPDEFDNGYYDGPTSGSAAFLLTAINTEGNWVGDNNAIPYTSSPGSFNVGGAATPAEIRVSQSSTEIADGDLDPSTEDGTNLGAVDVAGSTVTETFTIANTGGTVLNLGSVTISGTNAADFQMTTVLPATIAPSSSITFDVVFDPSAAGLRTAVVTVNSDDADEAAYNFALRGTGALPTGGTTLAVGDLAFVGFNSTADEFAFALLTDIAAGTVIKFTDAGWTGTGFRNASEGAVAWTAPRDYLTGEVVTYRTDTEAGRADFEATNEAGFFTSTFGPSSGGDQITAYQGTASATLSSFTNIAAIHYDGSAFDAGATSSSESAVPTGLTDGVNAISFGAGPTTDFNSGVWTRSLTPDVDALRASINDDANWVGSDATGGQTIDTSRVAFGTPEPEITVQGLGVTILDGATSANDTDGTSIEPIAIDAGAQQQTFTIFNQGTEALNVGTVTITGADSADFSVVSGGGVTIAPGTSSNLVVAFDPTTTGLKNATITINNNDTDEAAYDFAVNGIAQAVGGGTDLTAGSIAFTGFNSLGPDQFTFVLLEDIVTGTSIKFTDAGWIGATFRQTERALEWTALSDLPAGSVVLIDYTTVTSTPNVRIIDEGGYFTGSTSLSSSGDQVIAYQGTADASGASITNLAAVHFNTSEFDTGGTIGAGNSLIPTGLTDGVNAVSLGTGTSGSGTERDSGVYTGRTSGSFADLRAAIANEANWTTSTTFQTLSTAPMGNEAPSGTGLPVSVTVVEDTLSNIDLAALAFADLDSASITVTLTASAGTFAAPADGAGVGSGVTETLQSATVITLVGAPADINTYLDTASNIRYTTALNVSGNAAATITVIANDGDGSGNVNIGTVNVNVTAVNDNPTVSTLPASITASEDTQSNIALGAATFAEVDGDNITVTLTASAGTFAAPADGAGVGGGVVETLVNGTTITLVGAASDINTYLDTASNIQYTPATGVNGNAAATITVTANDGAGSGDVNLGTVNVNVTAVNDVPVFTGLDGIPTFTEGGAAQILDADVTVTDVELSSLNGGNGNFAGSSLVFVRDGGANTNDNFSVESAGNLTVSGSDILAGGNVFATINTGSAGQIAISFTDANGTTPTTALVNEVMQAIRYANGNNDPAANVQINWAFSDGNSANAQGTGDNPGIGNGSTTVAVTNINDAPILSATGGNPTFTEDGGAQDLFNTVTASTIEAADRFTSLTLTVTNVNDGASEILSFDGSDVALTDGNALTTATNGLSVSVSVVGSTATVSFTGATLTNAQMQTLVDAFTYRNASESPTITGNRVVTITNIEDNGGTVNGGVATASPNLTSTVTITALNDRPTLTDFGPDAGNVVYVAGSTTFVAFDSGTLANLQDLELDALNTGTGNYNGATVTLVRNGGVDTTDRFGIAGGTTALDNGSTVTVGSTNIGTVTAGSAGTGTITITFNSSATSALVDTLFQSIGYTNSNGAATGTVTIDVTLNDGNTSSQGSGGEQSVTQQVNVTIGNIPVIGNLSGDTAAFTESAGAVVIDQGGDATVTDADTPANLNGGNLAISVTGNANAAQDVLIFSTAGTVSLSGAAAGSNVSVGGVVIGTLANSIAAGNTLQVNLNTNATVANVQTLIQATTYINTSEEPTTANRTVSFVVTDDSGLSSTAATATVSVASVNDAPILTATALNPTYIEGAATVDLFNGVTASTIETTDRFTGLELTVSNVSDGADEIFSVDGSDIPLVDGTMVTTATTGFSAAVTVASDTATLTLSGVAATNAQIATLVDGLSYRNTSVNPTSANDRVVTVTEVTDNGGTADGGVDQSMPGVASTVAVVAVNDAPVVTNLAGDLVVLDPGSSANIDAGSDASVTEPDTGSLDGGSLRITDTSPANSANGNFSFDGTVVTAGMDGVITAGETVSVNGTAIGTIAAADGQGGNDLTINFSGVDATQARVQTLLQNVEWGAAAGNGDQTFTLTLDDNGGTANGGASSTTADFTMRLNFTPEIDNLNGDTTTFVNAGGPLKLDAGSDALLSDMDAPANLQGGVLTASITQNVRTAQDLLGVDGVNVTLSDTIAGSNVLVGGTVIGTLANDLTTGADLIVDLNADATLARIQTLLQNVTYDNTAGASPIGGVREISLTVSDGQGATSDAAVVNMTVIAPPPPPPAPTPTPPAAPVAASVTLANVSTELLRGATPSDQPQLVAIITTTGEGTAVLAGVDADLFEISGSGLFLRAGVDLSGRVGSEIEVRVTFGDASNDLSLPVVNTNFPGTGVDDELTGTPFADFFDGGDGVDTVVLPGMIGGHTITFDAAAIIVEERATGVIDSLLNIETITFEDGTSPVSTLDLTLFSGVLDTSEAQLEALSILYVTLFDRTPDAPGLFFWATQLGNGQAFENIAQQFLDSREFAETYGADADQATIVAQVYENLLDRAQDEAGATFWNDVLSQGGEFGLDDFVLAFVAGAQNNAEDRQAIEDQADISLYFSAIQGLSDPADGNAALNTYEIGNREETLAEAQTLIDSFAANIDNSLLLKVTGVVDDPFAMA